MKKEEGFVGKCVRKPIIPIVISIFVFLAGLFTFFSLEIRNQPKVEKGIFNVVINTVNPTRSEEVEEQITKKIGQVLPSVPNLEHFNSTSKSGESNTSVHFKEGVSEVNSLNDLRAAIGRVYLDSNTKPPLIYSSSGSEPMIYLSFYPTNDEEQNSSEYFDNLNNFLKDVLVPSIKKINGVGSVELSGHQEPQLEIKFNLLKIAQLGLHPSDIGRAIDQETIISTYQNITTQVNSFICTSKKTIQDLKSLGNIVVDGKRNILLKDISTISLKNPEPHRTRLLWGNKKMIFLYIYKTGEGNPLFIGEEVNKVLKNLVGKNTQYLLHNNFERSKIILKKTKRTIVEAIILLLLILVLFLGSAYLLLLPLITIPLSIFGTFVCMWYLKLSINEITLMGFLLSIGLLVDDAILVIENIERWRKQKKKLDDTLVIDSTLEIYGPIVVMTGTLFCVFLPVIFLPGEIGYILREFALTLSISVGWSGFFSIVLTPVMCKYFMKNYKPYKWTETFLQKLEYIYKKILLIVLKSKKKVLGFLLIFNFLGFLLVIGIKSEYYPKTKNEYFGFYTIGLKNMKLKYLKDQKRPEINKVIRPYKKYMDYYSFEITNGEINIFGKFLLGNKEIFNEKIKKALKTQLPNITFLESGSGSEGMHFNLIFSSYKEEDLEDKVYDFIKNLEKTNKIKEYSFIRETSYSYTLEVDNKKCAHNKIHPNQVNSYLNYIFQSHKLQGKVISDDNKRFNVVIKSNTKDLKELMSFPWKVPNGRGGKSTINLYNLVKIQPVIKRTSISTHNGLKSEKVSILCKKEVTAGDMYKTLQELKKNQLKDIYLDYTGDIKNYEKNSGKILYILIACLLSIFLILAIQFNSFLSSIIIMLTVPLAFTGTIICLYFFGTINIFSTIGGITLIGLITKQGILFMNREGDPITIALERMRPLLMTTLSMILGSLPLLFYSDSAMIPLKQMGIVIVPGLFYGTLMILIIFPIILSFRKNKL